MLGTGEMTEEILVEEEEEGEATEETDVIREAAEVLDVVTEEGVEEELDVMAEGVVAVVAAVPVEDDQTKLM